MIKFIAIVIGLLIVGFLIAQNTWMVTVSAFGFEIRTSIIFVLAVVLLLWYVLHLLKKPFCWIGGCQKWYANRKQTQKEAFLLLALKTALDRDSESAQKLLKQKNSFFDKKSDENYVLEALFAPTPHVFEQLLHREKTELAGVRGLLNYAREQGDYAEIGRLLQKAFEKHPNEVWVHEALWQAQILQNDWSESLKTLESLKKSGRIGKDEYTKRKTCVLLKLGKVQEAYKLMPEAPETAMAFVAENSQKAESVLMKLWEKTPCWDAFLLFQKAIREEKPAKQVKLVEKMVKYNPDNRLSLLAVARVALDNEMWGIAKEKLTVYMEMYSLTSVAARMMAEAERKGWHHEEGAKAWEEKAVNAPNEMGWGCSVCGHMTGGWDAVCPKCNAFNSIRYK